MGLNNKLKELMLSSNDNKEKEKRMTISISKWISYLMSLNLLHNFLKIFGRVQSIIWRTIDENGQRRHYVKRRV